MSNHMVELLLGNNVGQKGSGSIGSALAQTGVLGQFPNRAQMSSAGMTLASSPRDKDQQVPCNAEE